jgi:hypothetical protein
MRASTVRGLAIRCLTHLAASIQEQTEIVWRYNTYRAINTLHIGYEDQLLDRAQREHLIVLLVRKEKNTEFTLEEATKAQRGRCIAILFL